MSYLTPTDCYQTYLHHLCALIYFEVNMTQDTQDAAKSNLQLVLLPV